MDPYCTVQTHTHTEINTYTQSLPLTVFFSHTQAQSVNKTEPSDASSGCRIVWGGLCIALVQPEPKEETVFVSLSLWGCRHSCNWNALHVADWRDNLLAMCFSHSHVMRLGSGCRDFIYILVKKRKRKRGKKRTCQQKIGKLSWCMNGRAGQGQFFGCSSCIRERRVSCREQCIGQGHSFSTHSALKHGITAVTTINFSMGSVAIMTYSWHTLSYWPDRQYWFIEKNPYVVMATGGNGGWQSCWRWGVV